MMTIRELKDILVHFDDSCDDYRIALWDYNHQRELEWAGVHAYSKSEKILSFSVEVPTEDGKTIFERLAEFCKNQQENGICKKDK